MCGQRPDTSMTQGPTWAECGMDKGLGKLWPGPPGHRHHCIWAQLLILRHSCWQMQAPPASVLEDVWERGLRSHKGACQQQSPASGWVSPTLADSRDTSQEGNPLRDSEAMCAAGKL